MDKIIDNLYLGDIQAASNMFMLKKLVLLQLVKSFQGITHILQVAAGFQPMFPNVPTLMV